MKDDNAVINQQLTYENLNNLPYLSMCINETLRLTPSAQMSFMFKVTETITLNGYKILKDHGCGIFIELLHKNPDEW